MAIDCSCDLEASRSSGRVYIYGSLSNFFSFSCIVRLSDCRWAARVILVDRCGCDHVLGHVFRDAFAQIQSEAEELHACISSGD